MNVKIWHKSREHKRQAPPYSACPFLTLHYIANLKCTAMLYNLETEAWISKDEACRKPKKQLCHVHQGSFHLEAKQPGQSGQASQPGHLGKQPKGWQHEGENTLNSKYRELHNLNTKEENAIDTPSRSIKQNLNFTQQLRKQIKCYTSFASFNPRISKIVKTPPTSRNSAKNLCLNIHIKIYQKPIISKIRHTGDQEMPPPKISKTIVIGRYSCTKKYQ